MECKKCLSNLTISSLKLNKNGICQFCKIHEEMDKEYFIESNDFLKFIKPLIRVPSLFNLVSSYSLLSSVNIYFFSFSSPTLVYILYHIFKKLSITI